MRYPRPLAAVLPFVFALLLVLPLQARSRSVPPTTALDPLQVSAANTTPLPPVIEALWQRADGAVQRGEVQRGWLWGPTALGMTTEHHADSPSSTRRMAWFDKGRIDVLDPAGDAGSPWYATGAQLVTEMIAGAVQFGSEEWVRRDPPAIPVAGDPVQPDAVTYATLARISTLPSALRGDAPDNAAPDDTGGPVTALLRADGSIEPGSVTSHDVRVARWDAATGHNVAAPFAEWEAAQPYPVLWLLGHPLSEPYWIDAVVDGRPRRVLIQAFERRLLSWTPDNPSGWQLESANSGLHYRAWRGLTGIDAGALAPVVAFEPHAEELFAAATGRGIDPLLLIALAQVASGADPTSGRGLLRLPRDVEVGNVNDPVASAGAAAQRLTAELQAAGDERAALMAYHGGGGDAAGAFADAVLARRAELQTGYGPGAAQAAAPAQPLAALEVTTAFRYPAEVSDDAWGRMLAWYAGWGGALAGWQPDPQGFACTLAGYLPGDRLRVVSGAAAVDCTVAADARLAGERAGLGLSRGAADALALGESGSVRVYHLGPVATTGLATRIGSGAAAHYASGYDRGWWEWALAYHAGNGRAVPGWTPDPNGYYCVHPDLLPGSRLRLVANGRTLDCTIGDSVQEYDKPAWRSRWAVELSWDTFTALGLDGANSVEVYVVK